MAGDLTLKLRISADGTAAVTSLRQVEGATQRLGPAAARARSDLNPMNRELERTSPAASKAEQAFGALGRRLLALVAVTQVARSFAQANVEAGRLRGSLETVTGSVEAASAAWRDLERFAAQTPYALEQGVTAFTRLKALGLDPSEAALRSYGNTASAMGKDLMQMVEAVADATVGEFERLKEFGIRARAEGANVALTFRGVTTRVERDAKAIEGYLRGIGEAEFAGAMERQMATLGGALSNLGDSAGRFWRALGDSGAAALVANLLRDVGGWLDGLSQKLEDNAGRSREFAAGLEELWRILNRQVPAGFWLGQAWEALKSAAMVPQVRALVGGLADDVADLGATSAAYLGEARNRTEDWAAALQRLAGDLAKVDARILAGGQSLEAMLERDAIMDKMRGYALLMEQERDHTIDATAATDGQIRSLRDLLGVLDELESKAGIPAYIMRTLKQIETGSGMDPNVLGPVTDSGERARGLWQFMPGTAKAYAYGDSIMSQTKAAVAYVQDSIARGGADLENIFSSYVAGIEWRTTKRSPKAEAYRKRYVAEAIALYRDLAATGAAGNTAYQEQLGKIDQMHARQLDQERAFAEQRAALVAQGQGRVAEIEAEYAARIAAAQRAEDVDPASVAATVAALEDARAREILRVRQETADATLDITKRTMDEEARLRVEAAQAIVAVEREAGLPAADRAARISAILQGLEQDLDRVNGRVPLTRQRMKELAREYGTAGAALETYRERLREVDALHAAGLMTAREQAQAVEAIGIAYAKTQGPMAAYFAGLRESMGGLEGVAVDVLESLRSTLVEGLAKGKLAFDDFVDYVKKRLIEIAVNKILVSITGVVGVTGAAGVAAQGGAAGSAASSAASSGGLSLGGIGSWFSGSSIGQGVAEGVAAGLTKLGFVGGTNTQLALGGLSAVPNWALGVGGIGGGLLGSALFGGKGYSGIGASVGSGLGSLGGAALAGVLGIATGGVGAILGGLLGGVAGGGIGSLFGGGEQKDPVAWIDIQGGRFAGTRQQGMTDEAVQGILGAIDTVNAALQGAAEILGPDAQSVLKGVSRTDGAQALSPDQIEGWLQHEAERMVGYMVNAVPGDLGNAIREAFEGTEGNLQAFLAQVQQLQIVFEALPAVVDALSAAGLTLGQDAEATALALVKAAGSLDALAQAQASLGQVMYSDAERQAQVQAALTRTLGDLGIAVPDTREALRDLVQGLDLSTESGREAYLTLAALSDALGQVISASEAAAEAARQEAEAKSAATQAATSSLEALILTDQQLAALAAQRAAAEANAIGIAKLGIDVTRLTQAQFADAITGLGGVGAAIAALGDRAADFVRAASDYYSALKSAAADRAAADRADRAAADMAAAAERAVRAQAAQAAQAARSATDQELSALREWVADTRGALADEVAQTPASFAALQSAFLQSLQGTWRRDKTSLGRVTQDADAYLQSARVRSRDRAEYERTVGLVTAQVEAALQGNRRSSDNPLTNMVDWQRRMAKLLDRWEVVGMPASRA